MFQQKTYYLELARRLSREAEGMAQGKTRKKRTGWSHFLSDHFGQGDGYGRYSLRLDHALDQSHGLVADSSSRG